LSSETSAYKQPGTTAAQYLIERDSITRHDEQKTMGGRISDGIVLEMEYSCAKRTTNKSGLNEEEVI
jgi:hypothetical protein